MMGLGVFILPDEKLNAKIIQWKNLVVRELNDQPYTNHPPHLTIIHSEIEDKEATTNEIKEYLCSLKSFYLTVNKNNVFWDDLFTSGHTLTYNIKKNVYLNNIQLKLSLIFSKYKKHIIIPNSFRKHKHLYDSYVNYGFPFVGRHWIPHFTISSLRVEKNNMLIKKFLLDKLDISIKVNKISVWDINGSQHQIIDEFPLQ
tara:strand:+ start:421 stop:1020 length:600 start_codon:yes stop_codon:yes gene_type:complete